jgi:hypothetical protein
VHSLLLAFDAPGRFELSETVLPDAAGLDVTLQTLGPASTGEVGFSNQFEVSLE